jgi:O-methyltransferase
MVKQLVKAFVAQRISRRIQDALPSLKQFDDVKAKEALVAAVTQFAADRGFDDAQRFELFYEIGRKLQPDFSINDRGRVFLKDEAFRNYYNRFIDASQNWKPFERRWTVGQMLRLLPDVPGNLAECGVFEGATAFQLCKFAHKYGRKVHLFDSFQGVSTPNENDGAHWSKGDLSASEATLRTNLKEFDCFETFPGWIPSRFSDVADHEYAFVHIDVDLEQPTYDSIAFFYPRMSAGAVMILDDHGYDTCPGARKAALDYMADKPEPVLDLATGQGLIVRAAVRSE